MSYNRSSKTILIFGATGFLGSRLVEAFIKNHKIIVLKRRGSDAERLKHYRDQISFFNVEDGLEKAFSDAGPVDVVIHAATNYGRKGELASEIVGSNLDLPLKLLEAAILFRVGIFINTDTALPRFLNFYSLSKKQFLEWGKHFSAQKKIRFINVQFDHLYGPGDDVLKFPYYITLRCLDNSGSLDLTSGEQKRNFVYIDDVVSAYLKIVVHCFSAKEPYLEYGVGDKMSVSVKYFVLLVHRLTKSKTILNFGVLPYREKEMMSAAIQISPLKKLGWKCRTSLEEGIRKMIAHAKRSR